MYYSVYFSYPVQILAFYIIFYSVLVLIFAIHLGVFMALTPSPHINTTPWNYGRYAYSNYPNAKLGKNEL